MHIKYLAQCLHIVRAQSMNYYYYKQSTTIRIMQVLTSEGMKQPHKIHGGTIFMLEIWEGPTPLLQILSLLSDTAF